MQPKVIGASISAILFFDTIASIASRAFSFPYEHAAVGSYVLYVVIGFFAARTARGNAILVAVQTAALSGLADASLGWAISWSIGPGKLPSPLELTIGIWLVAAVSVTAMASALGAIGGMFGRRRLAER